MKASTSDLVLKVLPEDAAHVSDGGSPKFRFNNPLLPERVHLSCTDFSQLREKHRELQREVGHKLIDLGYSVVVFDYPIILKRKEWRRLDKRASTWGIGKIADVLGFRQTKWWDRKRTKDEICWVECGSKRRIKILLEDPDLPPSSHALSASSIMIGNAALQRFG